MATNGYNTSGNNITTNGKEYSSSASILDPTSTSAYSSYLSKSESVTTAATTSAASTSGSSSGPGLSFFLKRDAGMINGNANSEAESPPPRPPSYYAQKGTYLQKGDTPSAATLGSIPEKKATTSPYSTLTANSASKSPPSSEATSPRKGTIGGVNTSLFETATPPTAEAKTIFKDFKYYGGNLTTSTYTPAIISPSASSMGSSSGLAAIANGTAAVTNISPSKSKTASLYATLPKGSSSSMTASGASNGNSVSSYGQYSPYSSALNTSTSSHSSAATTTSNYSTNSSSGYNSLSSAYKVPYSSTNPFLPSFEHKPTTTDALLGDAGTTTTTTTNSTTKAKGYHFN